MTETSPERPIDNVLNALVAPIKNKSRSDLQGLQCSLVPWTHTPRIDNLIRQCPIPGGHELRWEALATALKRMLHIDAASASDHTEEPLMLCLWSNTALEPAETYRFGAPWYRRWLSRSNLVPDDVKPYFSTIAGQETDSGVVYRGEGVAYSGPIRSKLAREWELDEKGLVDLQRTRLREARHYVSYDDEERLLAECQHLGIWMNVIDFTDDPAVALWFAGSEAAGSDGQVRFVEESRLSGRVIRISDPPQRMIDQKGLLVFVEDGEIRENEITRTIRVAGCDKPEILRVLELRLGIARNSLFRDLDGFRHEIETGHVRFVKAELRAGALAVERGDHRRAVEFLKRCVASHRNKRPEDGGFPNIVPLRNLAIAYMCLGETQRAEQTAEGALKIAERACRGGSGSDSRNRVLRETRDLYRRIKWARRFRALLDRGVPRSDPS